jgi:hypothetical protein
MKYAVPSGLGHVVPREPGDETVRDAVVFLLPLPDGPVWVLEGSAALIWVVAAEGVAHPARAVAELAGLELDGDLEAAVSGYLDDLVGRGLLEVTS